MIENKKDILSDVPSVNRKEKPTNGTVVRKFQMNGRTGLTTCPDRPRIRIGSVNCKQCWNLLVYDSEQMIVKCKQAVNDGE